MRRVLVVDAHAAEWALQADRFPDEAIFQCLSLLVILCGGRARLCEILLALAVPVLGKSYARARRRAEWRTKDESSAQGDKGRGKSYCKYVSLHVFSFVCFASKDRGPRYWLIAPQPAADRKKPAPRGSGQGYADLVTTSVLAQKEFIPKAEHAADKALELDEGLAEAHYTQAGLKLIAWDWAAAERELKRTIELNPNLSRARRRYAMYLNIMGRHEEAVAEGKYAQELDPLSRSRFWLILARHYDQRLRLRKRYWR